MFTFFGEFSNRSCSRINTLSNYFENIESELNITQSSGGNSHIATGQSAKGAFPKTTKPNIDKEHSRYYALNGYLLNSGKYKNAAESNGIYQTEVGDALLDNEEFLLPDSISGLFVYLTADLLQGKIKVLSDLSGLIPFYFAVTNDGALLFSSHIRPLAKTLCAEEDHTGIIEQSVFHHSIGKRTVFKGISRLNPGELLTYDLSSRDVSFSQTPGYYSQIETYNSDGEAADALWADYLLGTEMISEIPGTKGVLLSGGFDSRLVVAGLDHFSNRLAVVTLGDSDNYEVGIAKQVANLAQASQVVHNPTQDHDLTDERVRRLINRAEFMNFPYCETSGQILKNLGAVTASTGYGGESFLGGQAYYLFGQRLNQKNRLLMAVKRTLGLPYRFLERIDYKQTDLLVNHVYSFFSHWLQNSKDIFSPVYQDMIGMADKDLYEDIHQEISRILLNDPETIQQVLERFWIEHHVLKHFGRQELTLMTELPVVLPTTHHPFICRCSNLDPSRKIDHGIYLQLVQRHLNKYAKIPTANIPIDLMNPSLLIWMSRAWRAKVDSEYMDKLMKRKGEIGRHRYGWSNFEIWLRMSTFLEDYQRYISKETYSAGYIDNRIASVKSWTQRVYSGQDLLTFLSVSQVIKK